MMGQYNALQRRMYLVNEECAAVRDRFKRTTPPLLQTCVTSCDMDQPGNVDRARQLIALHHVAERLTRRQEALRAESIEMEARVGAIVQQLPSAAGQGSFSRLRSEFKKLSYEVVGKAVSAGSAESDVPSFIPFTISGPAGARQGRASRAVHLHPSTGECALGGGRQDSLPCQVCQAIPLRPARRPRVQSADRRLQPHGGVHRKSYVLLMESRECLKRAFEVEDEMNGIQ